MDELKTACAASWADIGSRGLMTVVVEPVSYPIATLV